MTAFERAWALVKVDVDYQFGMTTRNQAGVEKPISGGYNFKDKNIKFNPGELYQATNRALERAGIDRKPTDQELIAGLADASLHEGVHAADHQLHGKKWLETPIYDVEMAAHLMQTPLQPRTRMQMMRNHPHFDDFGFKNKQYIEDYLRDVSSDSEGVSRTLSNNFAARRNNNDSI